MHARIEITRENATRLLISAIGKKGYRDVNKAWMSFEIPKKAWHEARNGNEKLIDDCIADFMLHVAEFVLGESNG